MEDNRTKDERIADIKKEIDEYHKLAQVQNKEMAESANVKALFFKSIHWAFVAWGIVAVIAGLWIANNVTVFESISIKDILFPAFMISWAAYLLVNSISLFIVSASDSIEGYSKWKVRRSGLVLLLFGVVLGIIAVSQIMQLLPAS